VKKISASAETVGVSKTATPTSTEILWFERAVSLASFFLFFNVPLLVATVVSNCDSDSSMRFRDNLREAAQTTARDASQFRLACAREPGRLWRAGFGQGE
jgi:hypothetical protein